MQVPDAQVEPASQVGQGGIEQQPGDIAAMGHLHARRSGPVRDLAEPVEFLLR